MRIALGAGGVAVLSALATAIVLPPQYSAPAQQQADPGQQAAGQLSTDSSASPRPILYVQLSPGQSAPPGAIVIDASAMPGTAGSTTGAGTGQSTSQKAATPTVQITPKPKPAPIKTTQSGKVKP